MLKDQSLLRNQTLIDGKWQAADSGKTFSVSNPFDGSHIGDVPDMGASETRRAINAANAALPAWRAKTAGERAAILLRWRDLLKEHLEDLAILMTTEQGKPLAEARGEINYTIAFFEWFAEEGKRIYGDVIPTHAAGLRNLVIKQPVGVVAAITPWNFPVAMVGKKLPAALAAGCTMVWKPAEDTPLSGLALAALGQRAGLPDGVFNVITTSNAAPVGGEMCSNDIVRKISFTGSTNVGKLLMQQSAATVKKVSMELGGNAPFIVFDDADVDAAVTGAIASKFRNAGQTCVCANRILVQDNIYDTFTRKFAEAVEKLQAGNGLDPAVVVGPLINTAAIEKVERLVADARDNGAKVIIGGNRHAEGGTFFQPTVLSDVPFTAACAREEIFGPVAPVYRFQDEAEAIYQANNTEYGLAAYFFSRDIGRIWRVGEALEYGMVGANTGMISTAVAPFGGVKASGLGREGSHYGLDDYLEIKFLCLGGIDQ